MSTKPTPTHSRSRGAAADRPVALVTGASGGIGLELARVLAADGYDLVLVARSEDRLRSEAEGLGSTYGVRAHVVSLDLAEAGAPTSLAATTERLGLSVDVLVNNAGFATYGPLEDTDPDALLGMLQLNIHALTHLTRLYLPGMLARRRGAVMNVASVAAFMPGPLMAGYYASKAYVLSFSEALASETEGSGVTVTALCPGPVRTGFQDRAGMNGARFLQSAAMMSARDVAKAGVRGMKEGRTVVVPGLANRAGAFLPRLVPRSLLARGIRYFQDRPEGVERP